MRLIIKTMNNQLPTIYKGVIKYGWQVTGPKAEANVLFITVQGGKTEKVEGVTSVTIGRGAN